MESREVLKTLLYSDIFDFPLKEEEIYYYLISPKKVSKKKVLLEIENERKKKTVDEFKGMYFIRGKRKSAEQRLRNERIVEKKIDLARQIAGRIGIIPTISFIGISGGLSMRNARPADDIDFFVITKSKTLWVTRILMVLGLLIMGVYRKRNDRNVRNKICLNMLIDERSMGFKERSRNIYIAHEISQIIPLFERNKTYKKFLSKNLWIGKFLANFKEKEVQISKNKGNKILVSLIGNLEGFSQFLQIIYMRNHVTNETLDKGYAAFHPFDYGAYILSEYRKRATRYGVLDKKSPNYYTRGY